MARFLRIVRRLPLWLAAVVICFLSGELIARLDDWIFQDVPFNANPDREYDLTQIDDKGIRGRSNGKFKKYKLNSHGFRGPEIDLAKPEKTIRVMTLGASETFGLYESEGHEYPALLRKALGESLPDGTKVEVVNAAVAAVSLPNMIDSWRNWARAFQPDVVLIYPSPQFYLDNEPPGRLFDILAKLGPDSDPIGFVGPQRPAFCSRFLERLKDSAKQSDLIKSLRVRFLLSRELAGKDAAWFFNEVPADRVERFSQDLELLSQSVVHGGARPVLVTHAFKSPSPPDARDLAELKAFRIFFPRAEPNVMPAFDAAARQATLDLGRRYDWPVIDAAAELSGKRALFADPVHFNDAGSHAMADLLARELQPLLQNAKGAR